MKNTPEFDQEPIKMRFRIQMMDLAIAIEISMPSTLLDILIYTDNLLSKRTFK